jgi:CheY-like chemotaxis protein/HPt (histidine-containing phosphotransfer) domain-containing protein
VERPLRARHLVAAATGNAPGTAAPSAGARLAGVRILAVDDDESARLVLRGMLEGEGARVVCAESGAVALSILRERGAAAFDALLTDVQMPGLDGYETARRARALGASLPVLGVTAYTSPEERDRCLAAGMVERLTKPLALEELVATLRRHATPRAEAEPPPPAPPPPAPSSLDWAALSARLGGNATAVDEVAAATLRAHREAPAQLRAAAADRDPAAIGAIAHRLRGACGNLAAGEAFALAGRVEIAARGRDEAVTALALDLAASTERLLAALAAGPPAIP